MSERTPVKQIKTRLMLRHFDANGNQTQRGVVVKGTAEENQKTIDSAKPGERIKFVKSDQHDEESTAFYTKEEIINVEDFIVRS
jgi:hypothetical protein